MASGHLCQFVGAADCNIVGDCQISQSHRFVSKYPLWEKLKNIGDLIRAPISWFPPQSLGEWHILLDRLPSQTNTVTGMVYSPGIFIEGLASIF